jgi:hypothetical protein
MEQVNCHCKTTAQFFVLPQLYKYNRFPPQPTLAVPNSERLSTTPWQATNTSKPTYAAHLTNGRNAGSWGNLRSPKISNEKTTSDIEQIAIWVASKKNSSVAIIDFSSSRTVRMYVPRYVGSF